MLGNRRLRAIQRLDELAHRPLFERQQAQDVAPASLGDSVEDISSGCGACHCR